MYLGLEYTVKGVDVKLFDTAPSGSYDDVYLDLVSAGCPKIQRRE